jgi:LPXTG-site transpeptidase (sortase) family protein
MAALAGLVAGLALLGVPATLWWATSAAPAAAVGTAAITVAAPPSSSAATGGVAPVPTATGAPTAPAAPARIDIGGIGVAAPVVAVGVDARGRMEVPLDVRTVGWYRYGPGPGGGRGSAVLSGHVDDREQGLGAFHRLADVSVGDPVTVALADGTVLDYRVRTVERVPKTDLPVDLVFRRDGPPLLTLVTCGGEFDRAASGYTDNVVVVAEPGTGP